MAIYTKQLLSKSQYGEPISLSATGIGVQTIHTTLSNADVTDEVWLYASNCTETDLLLEILYGGNHFERNVLFYGIIEGYSGNVLVCPGAILKGINNQPSTIFGVTPLSGINIFGYVNRISG